MAIVAVGLLLSPLLVATLPGVLVLGMFLGMGGAGFLSGAVLSLIVVVALLFVMKQRTTTWVGAGGKALQDAHLETRATVGTMQGGRP